MNRKKETGTQFVTHATRVVSVAHRHNLRAKQRPTKPPDVCCSKRVCWGDLMNEHSTIYAGRCTAFWWFTNVMCFSTVHVSYCEWLLESVIQIGGPFAVFHNRWCLVENFSDLSQQSVLGLHDLWTCLPVTFTHKEHCRKKFYNKNPLTLAELEANAQAETVTIHDRKLQVCSNALPKMHSAMSRYVGRALVDRLHVHIG